MKTIANDLTNRFVKEVGTARDKLEEYDQLAKDLAAKDEIDLTTYTPIDSIGQGRGLMPKPPTYWPARITWAWPDGERKDRTSEPRRVSRRKLSELSLGRRCEFDAPTTLTHASSDP